MENSTSPKGAKKLVQKEQPKTPQKSQTARKPLVDLDEKIERVSDAPTQKLKRYFKKTTYIKGFGVVAVGEALTGEMAKAWAENTSVKIDAYVGKKSEALNELPKTDKQKLAEYEAQNKD